MGIWPSGGPTFCWRAEGRRSEGSNFSRGLEVGGLRFFLRAGGRRAKIFPEGRRSEGSDFCGGPKKCPSMVRGHVSFSRIAYHAMCLFSSTQSISILLINLIHYTKFTCIKIRIIYNNLIKNRESRIANTIFLLINYTINPNFSFMHVNCVWWWCMILMRNRLYYVVENGIWPGTRSQACATYKPIRIAYRTCTNKFDNLWNTFDSICSF